MLPTGDLLTVNLDQNLFTYEVRTKASKMKLARKSSFCLYLDEVIDLKFIGPSNEYAFVSTNSETLKLLHLESNQMELYTGHEDIILCLDVCPKRSFVVSGSKDNEIRLWHYDLEADF